MCLQPLPVPIFHRCLPKSVWHQIKKKKTTTQLIRPAVWHQASLCMTSMDYKRNSNSPNRYPGSTLRWTNRQEVSQLTPHSLCSSAVTCFYQRWRQIPKLHSVDLNSGVLIHDCELQINYIVCGCFTVSCKKYSAGYILLSLTLNQSSLVPPQQTHRMNGFNYAFYSVPLCRNHKPNTHEWGRWLSVFGCLITQQKDNNNNNLTERSWCPFLSFSTSRLHMCSKQN